MGKDEVKKNVETLGGGLDWRTQASERENWWKMCVFGWEWVVWNTESFQVDHNMPWCSMFFFFFKQLVRNFL